MKFSPMDILSAEECDCIHSATMDILRNIGVHVGSPEARTVLAEAGASILLGERVSIPEEVVLTAVECAPSTIVLTGLDPTRGVEIGGKSVNFMSGAGILDVLDLDGKIRASTLDDLVEFTRLCDALEYLDLNHGILDPRDAQGPGLYPLAASRIIPHSRKPTALVIDTARDVEAIAEMAAVALGSAQAARERPFFTIHDSNTRPPLYLDDKNFEVILAACQRGFPTGLTSWPMPGLSSPVTVAGSMAQKYAEFFTGLVLAQTINPGNPFIFPIEIGGAEMRRGNVVTASPEIALAGMAGAQMARYYGLPSVAVTATDAKTPDAQAGAEKAFLLTAQALAGINLIHGCTSEMDGMMIASLEQCVIDNDIMGMVRRLVSGFPIDAESLALEVIAAVAPADGSYLSHPHTLAHYREAIFEPRVFTRERRAEWLEHGGLSARQAAAERARKILAEDRPSILSSQQIAEIEHIAVVYS
jgi:trimethylamine--corrinoid protein Co-methyltransferase